METVLLSVQKWLLQLTTYFDCCKTMIRDGETVEAERGYDSLLADPGGCGWSLPDAQSGLDSGI